VRQPSSDKLSPLARVGDLAAQLLVAGEASNLRLPNVDSTFRVNDK